jgi:F-type H+-transporting ATPase subunit b
MLIDWFTVIAQAVNFLILVWLLKRYLYKPVLDGIAAREKRIADEIKSANDKMAEAKKEKDDFENKNKDLDQKRAALIEQAEADAKTKRKELFEAAQKDCDNFAKSQRQSLQSDADALSQSVCKRAGQEVFAISRKVLTELASVNLENTIVEVFVKRLRELDQDTKNKLAKSLSDSSEQSTITSTFEMAAEHQGEIRKALNDTFAAEVKVSFKTSADLVSGIEFASGEQKLDWNISAYLNSLENDIEKLLKAKPVVETPGPDSSKLVGLVAGNKNGKTV